MAKAPIFTGRPAEAVPHVERAMRLDPRFAVLVSGPAVQISTTPAATYLFTLGLARFVEGDLQAAVTLLERALERDPDDYVAAAPLAAAYAHLGRSSEASAALDRLRRGREEAFGRATDIAYERQAWPFERPADMERFLDGLHRAGLG
jgi:adenylate cyclase